MPKFSNYHFLNFTCPVTINDQDFHQKIILIFKQFNIVTEFKINLIKKYDKEINDYKSAGVGYLWVKSLSASNVLLGNHKKNEKSNSEIYDSSKKETDINDWSQIEDDPEEIVEKQDSPILDLKVSDGELNFKVSEIIQIPEDSFELHNVLVSRHYFNITKKDIIDAVSQYSSSPGYPNVVIKKEFVILTFDPKTDDAQFALLMLKKTKIKDREYKFSHYNSK